MTNEELQAILMGMVDEDGTVKPERVVEEARARTHPLHERFEWNDKVAGQKYRLVQARQLINSVEISTTSQQRLVVDVTPAFIRDPRLGTDRQGYVPFVKVRSDVDLARDVVVAEFGRVTAALNRAKRVAKSLGLEEDIDAEIARISALMTRASISDAAAGSA